MTEKEKQIYEFIALKGQKINTFFLEEYKGKSHYDFRDKIINPKDYLDNAIKQLYSLYFALDREQMKSMEKLAKAIGVIIDEDSVITDFIFTHKIVKILQSYLGENATIRDLISHSEEEIKSLKGIGISRFKKIKDKITENGLRFREEN